MTPARTPAASRKGPSNRRVEFWYVLLVLVMGLMIARLFYLQIVKHDYYRQTALADQQKEYAIPAERGVIKAHDGNQLIPLVLNDELYTLYVDPVYIKDPVGDAQKLAAITGGSAGDYERAMRRADSRYVVLEKRLSEDKKNQIVALKRPGVAAQAVHYRTYPQGSLASQLLGFVNDEAKGNYGVEQALNGQLAGQPGRLKAVTDAQGVPLAASPGNIEISPKDGKEVVLTVEISMQKQLENILKAGLEKAKSTAGSALIMDANSGAIKAMANLPTYNPGEYYNVDDQNLFNNAAVSSALEVGSVMKTLTAAAALDMGAISTDTTFYDPGRWELNDHTITNIEEVGGPGTRTIPQVLDKSINTGATWILMQMGGKTGEVNKKARERWHDYMVNRYQLGKPTGVEQGYESAGTVPDPNDGFALELAYANTAFGQAMTATPLQMAAALASAVNGGTYYQPRLVDQIIAPDGKGQKVVPKVVKRGVVSGQVSQQLRDMMQYVVANHRPQPPFSDKYIVGGKTGTAQIANPSGGYYENKYNGTYIGFVGGDRPEYVVAIVVREPKIGGYAGSAAAQPIFWQIAHMLINNFDVAPKNL
jgi:cell division protein FtsI/penicillin-binding protein 2